VEIFGLSHFLQTVKHRYYHVSSRRTVTFCRQSMSIDAMMISPRRVNMEDNINDKRNRVCFGKCPVSRPQIEAVATQTKLHCSTKHHSSYLTLTRTRDDDENYINQLKERQVDASLILFSTAG